MKYLATSKMFKRHRIMKYFGNEGIELDCNAGAIPFAALIYLVCMATKYYEV